MKIEEYYIRKKLGQTIFNPPEMQEHLLLKFFGDLNLMIPKDIIRDFKLEELLK